MCGLYTQQVLKLQSEEHHTTPVQKLSAAKEKARKHQLMKTLSFHDSVSKYADKLSTAPDGMTPHTDTPQSQDKTSPAADESSTVAEVELIVQS